MKAPQSIEIVGGGLAGLSLGLALQNRGVTTTILEAGDYPRHRVCGEFIAGIRESTIETLGLKSMLSDAVQHRRVRWYRGDRILREQKLKRPALAISRHTLDTRLADAYSLAGGQLRRSTRVEPNATQPGRVWCIGRKRIRSEWLGLKVHAYGLPLGADLEFHLGANGYVGLSATEDGAVNVCGLFRVRNNLSVNRSSALLAYLTASHLPHLAARLLQSDLDEESFSAVAGLDFTGKETAPYSRIALGDAYAMIPPYTGNGMAMAFQSAETALEPLASWSSSGGSWDGTVQATMGAIARRFQRRLFLAGMLHPFFFSPTPQKLFGFFNRTKLLPLRALAEAVHG